MSKKSDLERSYEWSKANPSEWTAQHMLCVRMRLSEHIGDAELMN